MAIGRGGKRILKLEETAYLSDESDFYGDEDTKQELEQRALSFNPADFFERQTVSITEIANANSKKSKVVKTATLYNPYEGRLHGRQLTETVVEFLERLPPATTPQSDLVPWIFIANPYRKVPTDKRNYSGNIMDEAPADEDSDWAQFVILGGNLLEELTTIRHTVEKKNPEKAKAAITKVVNVHKDEIVKKLLDTAKELHCTSGKWMLFVQPEEVNAFWSVIAKATANNELGIAAKVAPDEGDTRKQRLICVYTEDFTDMKDVSRVLLKLKDLGVFEARGKGIYYKCDAYTYLGITSANEYKIKASLYNSKEILEWKPGQAKDAKLDGFFTKKKKETEDWQQMEWE